MLSGLTDRLVYPAPTPTYTANDLEGCLCWLPWNEAIPPPATASLSGPNFSRAFGGSKPPENGAKALPCLWLPAKRSANVVFYFHANAEDLGVVHSALVHLQKQLQVSVLAIEYPGYGLLKEQTASEEAICSAALVALRYIVSEVGVSYNQVMLLGRSLGSGPAVYLAARFPVGGLLLVNPFASLRGAAECHVGKMLSRLAFLDSFNNEELIGNVSCAVLFIHAARDRTVPMEHSARLFKKCRSRKLLITPEGMEHNSHLFADPTYLAVPAIHFFHFPCYQTDKPPALPPQVFKPPVTPKPWKPADCRTVPWACGGKFCHAVGGENDEVAIPAGAALLGQVDVTDNVLTAATGSARGDGSRLSPLPENGPSIPASVAETDEKSGFLRTPRSARDRYPIGAPTADPVQPAPGRSAGANSKQVQQPKQPPVAPGDESAGWPGALSDKEKAEFPGFPVSLDKMPENYDIDV